MARQPNPKLRSDLKWISYDEGRRWVLFDPVANSFFYLSKLEFETAQLLDGTRNFDQILSDLEQKPYEDRFCVSWIQLLVSKLEQARLLYPFSGRIPVAPPPRAGHLGFLQSIVTNPFAIRIPVLKFKQHGPWLVSFAKLLFHPVVVIGGLLASLLLTAAVVLKTISNPEKVFYNIEQLQGDRWLLLIGLYTVIKSLHELGHFLACAKYNVRCREIGLMLLMFAPCFYCDTTESWVLKSKWKRAFIAMAGIVVELWIAGVASFLYLTSQNELVKTLAAGAVMMCTLGTLLVNGNPLFRFDGYYILSDLWGVPNLTQQSQRARWAVFVKMLGARRDSIRKEFDKPVWMLAAFAVLASVYRTAMLFFIAIVVWKLFVPFGLGFVALFLLSLIGVGVAFGTKNLFESLFSELLSVKPIVGWRVALFMGCVVGLILSFFLVKLPHTIRCRGFLDLAEKTSIYWPESGTLRSIGKIGGRLQVGEEIFTVDAAEKRLELLGLEHELLELDAKIRIQSKMEVNDPSVALELPTQRELLEELKAKYKHLKPQVDALVQSAPQNGYFLPSYLPMSPALAGFKEKAEMGNALDATHQGIAFERGQLVGWFARELKYKVVALITEHDSRWIAPGMKVRIIRDAATNSYLLSEVGSVSPEPVQQLPPELAGDPSLVTARVLDGSYQSDMAHYLITVDLSNAPEDALRGSRITVEIDAPARTLWERLRDMLVLQFST